MKYFEKYRYYSYNENIVLIPCYMKLDNCRWYVKNKPFYTSLDECEKYFEKHKIGFYDYGERSITTILIKPYLLPHFIVPLYCKFKLMMKYFPRIV